MKLPAVLLTIALVAGCATPPAASPPPTGRGGADRAPGSLSLLVTASDLAVGPNHLAFAVLDDQNQPLADAPIKLTFYDLSGAQPMPLGSADAVWRRPLSEWTRGVYKADVTFERAGPHGLEATINQPDGTTQTVRTRFDVKPQSATPALGAAVPRSHNLTVRDAVDPIELCTGTAEVCAATNSLRQLTVADALALGKPLVVLFATPGFCTSATCGPQLEVFQTVANRYRDRASFIHVEIFKDPQTRTPNATVEEWSLPSEPWTFVVDASGNLADKFDGMTTPEEVEQALQRVLG
jgi:peroxiredoxin